MAGDKIDGRAGIAVVDAVTASEAAETLVDEIVLVQRRIGEERGERARKEVYRRR